MRKPDENLADTETSVIDLEDHRKAGIRDVLAGVDEQVEVVEEDPETGADLELANFVGNFDEFTSKLAQVSEAVGNAQTRANQMRRYADGLLAESARRKQLQKLAGDLQLVNTELKALVEEKSHQVDDLTEELRAKAALTENLSNDLAARSDDLSALQSELNDSRAALTSSESLAARRRADLDNATQHLEVAANETSQLRDANTALEAQLKETSAHLADVRARMATIEVQHEEAVKQQSALLDQNQRAADDRRRISADLAAARSEISATHLRVEELQDRRKQLLARLSAEQFTFDKEKRALKSEIQLLTAQRDEQANEAGRMTRTVEKITVERNALREEMLRDRSALESSRKDLSNSNLSISELGLKYSADLIKLEALADQNKRLEEELDKTRRAMVQISEYQDRAEIAESRAEKLEAKLAEYVNGMAAREEAFAPAEAADVDIPEDAVKH